MTIWSEWRLTRAGALFFGGIIIVGALLIGTIYFVQQRGEQARRDEAIKVAEQNLEEQSRVNEQPIAASSEAEEEQSGVPQQASTAAELPATGIELQAFAAVVFLSVATSYYVASRRALQHPAVRH